MGVFSLNLNEKPVNGVSIPSGGTDVEQSRTEDDSNISEISLFTKYTIFFINVLAFLCVGCGLLVYTILASTSTKHVYPLEDLWDFNLVLCVTAVVVCLVSALAIVGSIRENLNILYIYKYASIVLLLGEGIFAVVAIFYICVPASRSNIEFFPTKSFTQSMKDYPATVSAGKAVNSVDFVQAKFQCCGVSDSAVGFTDWMNVPEFRCDHQHNSNQLFCSVPISCCRDIKASNASCVNNIFKQKVVEIQNKIHIQGCLRGFHTWIDINGLFIVGIMLAIIFPQILMLMMTTSFMNQIIRQMATWDN
ncbi:tetraspanin-5-like [Argonauta hians]